MAEIERQDMRITVAIQRKEGGPISFRMSQDKLDLRLVGEWLIVNEKTGVFEQQPIPGSAGTMKVEKVYTIGIVPAWNVLDVQMIKPEGLG